jgi:hypothetical protein
MLPMRICDFQCRSHRTFWPCILTSARVKIPTAPSAMCPACLLVEILKNAASTFVKPLFLSLCVRRVAYQSTSIVSSPSSVLARGSTGTPLPRPANNSLLTSGPIPVCPCVSSRSNSCSLCSSVIWSLCKVSVSVCAPFLCL